MTTGPVDQNAANEMVRESLGLTADDLGMNPAEDAFGEEDNLESDNNDLSDNNDISDNTGFDPAARDDNVDDLLVAPKTPQPKVDPAPQQHKLAATAEVVADRRGNLVDKKTGQIVAKAGAEARMYQKLHRTTQAYTGLQAQHTDTVDRLNRAVEIGTGLFERLKELQAQQLETSPQKYGLSQTEAIEAMNFAKEAKTDPIGTIKKLLTRAAASGIDLTSIGLSGGNFDPKSLMDLVKSQIDTAMNPLKERSQRETAQEQQTREATERENAAKSELNTFLAANPGAKEYLPVFQQVYSQPQFQNMSLSEVWARLQLNLMRKARDTTLRSNQRPANQQRRQPLPSGRGVPPSSGRGRGNDELAPVSTSYEDIVRGLLT